MESNLAAHFKKLKADVGHFLGYGRGTDFGQKAWNQKQIDDITLSVEGGLRNFYHCDYDWSFLKPILEVTLAEGDNIVHLPADFAGLEGRISVSVSGGSIVCVLDDGGLAAVRQREDQSPNSTGQPQYLAKEPTKGTSQLRSNKWRLRVWPTADQDYTLKFQYYLLPEYLTGAKPYAYGGAQHAECLLESCLAIAEKIIDNKLDVHEAVFSKLLEQSKSMDRRNKPQFFGVNRDNSDNRGVRESLLNRGRLIDASVTFNGVQY